MSIVLEVILRSIIAFFVLLLLVRLLGKQQVSQLTHFDYIVGITIGSIASNLSVQVNDNFIATLAELTVWSVLAMLLAVSAIHSAWIRKVVDGKETVVIESGKVLDKNLKKTRIPLEQLLSELRTQGVFNIADVEFAMFEPGGKISVQKKSQMQPVTPKDLKVSTQYDGMPTNLIIDGAIIDGALNSIKLSKAWLYHQLSKQNITDINEVTLAQLDTKGNLYVDLKGDRPYFIISTK
jgi:uncharacterized membrane protein YcaP (DUF421 family)